MGASTAILAYCDEHPRHYLRAGLTADLPAAAALAAEVFPGTTLDPIGAGDLSLQTRPKRGTVYAGRFPGIDLLACSAFMLEPPTALPSHLLDLAKGRALHMHLMESVHDWLAIGSYRDGEWQRLMSVAPGSGVGADLGEPFDFEAPFWDGQLPMDVPYALPFHPLELGETALGAMFGFVMEGTAYDTHAYLSDMDITVQGFRIGEPQT